MAKGKKYCGYNASTPSHGAALKMGARLRVLLNHRGVRPIIKVALVRDSTQEFWQAYAPVHLPLDYPLQGVWTLSTYWRYVTVPGSDEALLQESSIGLNVSGHPLDECVGLESEVCLVRYDYDIRDAPAAHLNVLQPAPLRDRAHWRLPMGGRGVEWNPDEVLEYLLGPTVAELRSADWPSA